MRYGSVLALVHSCMRATRAWMLASFALPSPVSPCDVSSQIILFNSIYPFNAFATIFWLALPPWICILGEFPFTLSVWPAVIGSLLLRLVEFQLVGKMKKDSEHQGSQLDETSIFRSQQLDLVTVPIKIRAIMKGFSTGWNDLFQFHDNSWWESFGAGHTKAWVQTWLLSVFAVMVVALIVGPVRLIHAAVTTGFIQDMVFPILFGMTQVRAARLWRRRQSLTPAGPPWLHRQQAGLPCRPG